MRIEGEILEVGIDWITCVGFTPDSQNSMQSFAEQLIRQERDSGNDFRPWRFAGYEGFMCGGCQCGVRDDSTCVRLSSGLADSNWERLYAMSENATRIDLQVTIRPERPALKVLAQVHRQALRKAAKRSGGPTVTLIRSTDGSGTVYLGKRSSDAFGRVYLKGAESGLDHYHNALRFEVEFKGPQVRSAIAHISRESPRIVPVASLVSGFFTARGVDLQFPTIAKVMLCISRPLTSDAKRLAWIQNQVRPSVQLLISHGWYTEVLEALGLFESLTTVSDSSRLIQRVTEGE